MEIRSEAPRGLNLLLFLLGRMAWELGTNGCPFLTLLESRYFLAPSHFTDGETEAQRDYKTSVQRIWTQAVPIKKKQQERR